MAVQTLYVTGTAASSPGWYGILQINGSAPTAANSTYGWTVAKTAVTTPYWRARLGASTTATASSGTSNLVSPSSPTAGTGAANTTAGDSFRTAIGFYGTFANTAWTFNFNMRAGVAGAIGRLRMRLWRGINADGSGATQLTAAVQVGATVTLSTTADTNSSISWTPGSTLTFTGEFLFVQLEWEETTAGSSNTDTVLFRVGTASITTSDFTAATTPIWMPYDRSQLTSPGEIALSNGNLTATHASGTGSAGNPYNIRGSHAPINSANAYFEATMVTDRTLTAVSASIGVVNQVENFITMTIDLGNSNNSIAYTDDGRLVFNGAVQVSGLTQFITGDIVGIWLSSTTITFFINGVLGIRFTSLPSGSLYAAADLGDPSDAATLNYGATEFKFMPVGALSWDGSRRGQDIVRRSARTSLRR